MNLFERKLIYYEEREKESDIQIDKMLSFYIERKRDWKKEALNKEIFPHQNLSNTKLNSHYKNTLKMGVKCV